MKKFISTLLVSFFAMTVFAQWYWVNPTPIGANLNDIAFTNDKTGYVVGQGGTILKTTDMGEKWEYMSSGQLINYNMVHFTDEHTGYVTGGGGFMMKTTDSGETWARLETGMTHTAYNMHWIDNNTGFLCGGIRELLKTTDGGLTWNNVYPDSVFYSGYVYAVHFPTALIGYASGSIGTVLKTIDGGNTWIATTSEPMLELKDIFFINADTGFVAGDQGYFARTFNGGASWEDCNSPVISANKLYFTDYLTGFAISYGRLMKTTDGGVSWFEMGMNELTSFEFVNDTCVLGVGVHGRLFKSTDSGFNSVNYTSYLTEDDFSGIHFPDGNIGYAVTDLPGQVVKTTDAGETWEIVNSKTFARLYAVWFTDAVTGFVTNGYGLYRTNDGGFNWTEVEGVQWNSYLQKIMFVNPQVGYVSGESDGVIYKTIDGGNSWTEIYRDGFKWPRDIYFLNENLGYIATTNSVLKTNNGGETFTEFNFPDDNLFLSLYFPTETTGYVGSYKGKMYRTFDGGQNWTELIDTNRFVYTTDMFFVNENTGYISAGGIFQTNDSGETWTKINYMGEGSGEIWFTNGQKGYVVSNEGNIFKTINAGAVNVAKPVKPQPQYSVYPNPTNGLFSIVNPAYLSGVPISLSIYNSFGKIIFSGEYSNPLIQLDLREYPSGIYFVKIQGKEIKKVIINN